MAMNDFIGRMKQKEENKKNFRESLSYSFDYIDWLEQFTSKYGSFSTDTFLYDGELLTEQDKDNVSHLEEFFEDIYDYAQANYISPENITYGSFYKIQYRGIGYSIGIDYGQGCCFYCERFDNPGEDALDYKRVMSSVKLPNTIMWDSMLDELVTLIEKLDEEEVPIDAIESVTNHTIQKIKTRKQ